MYVCMFVCLYVCVYITALDLALHHAVGVKLDSAKGVFSNDVFLTALSERLCLAMVSAQHQCSGVRPALSGQYELL